MDLRDKINTVTLAHLVGGDASRVASSICEGLTPRTRLGPEVEPDPGHGPLFYGSKYNSFSQ